MHLNGYRAINLLLDVVLHCTISRFATLLGILSLSLLSLSSLSLFSLLSLSLLSPGLDAASSRELLAHLNNLAGSNRTVVLTIHQPRLEIFHMFDRLVLLSDGKVGR